MPSQTEDDRADWTVIGLIMQLSCTAKKKSHYEKEILISKDLNKLKAEIYYFVEVTILSYLGAFYAFKAFQVLKKGFAKCG